MLRIVRRTDYVVRPWKNGGGTTSDIVVSPPGASLDDFVWRVSLAQVDRDGSFSRFDGVDRTIVLLTGAMTLHDRDRRVQLVRNRPFVFDGECAFEAIVSGGSTLDFNVMTRRGRASHSVRAVALTGPTGVEAAAGRTVIVFALDGGLLLDGKQLGVHDTAIVTEQRVTISNAAAGVAVLLAEII